MSYLERARVVRIQIFGAIPISTHPLDRVMQLRLELSRQMEKWALLIGNDIWWSFRPPSVFAYRIWSVWSPSEFDTSLLVRYPAGGETEYRIAMPRFHIRWSIQKVDDSPEGVQAALLCAGGASYCGKSVPCQGRGYCGVLWRGELLSAVTAR